jgi:hypothetical protein
MIENEYPDRGKDDGGKARNKEGLHGALLSPI